MMRNFIILAQKGYLLSYVANTGSLEAVRQYDGTNINVRNAENREESLKCQRWQICHQPDFVSTAQHFIQLVLIVLGHSQSRLADALKNGGELYLNV